MTTNKTAQIFVLHGYDDPNATDSVASCYALTLETLSVGGWANQGMFERATTVWVSIHSNEYCSAVTNTACIENWA